MKHVKPTYLLFAGLAGLILIFGTFAIQRSEDLTTGFSRAVPSIYPENIPNETIAEAMLDADLQAKVNAGSGSNFHNLTAMTSIANEDELHFYNISSLDYFKITLANLASGIAGSGEANTASSQGSGTSIYYQKSGVDLQFNAIKSENNRLSVSLDGVTHDVEFTINESNIDHDALSNYNILEHFTMANITTLGTVTTGDISAIESDPGISTHESTYNHANYNTAYGWGDHASAGYLNSTSLNTETELESQLGSLDVFTENDGSLADDDVSLGDVQTATSSDFHNIGGADDDQPESGEFGNGADLENDGSLSNDVVAAAEMANADHGDVSWSSGVASVEDLTIAGEAQSDVLYFNGSNWVRLAKGSAGQVLEMNATATAPEWDTDDGAGAASIEDDAYSSGWNGDTVNGASQNAIYDYLHQIDTDDDGDVENIAADSVALTTDTTGNYVKDVADGTGIDGTASGEGATYTPTLDLTEVTGNVSWNDGATDVSFTWTYDLSTGTDPIWTISNGVMNLSTGTLQAGGVAVLTSESDPNALLTAGTDNVKDSHIDWGTGVGQVSADDIGNGSTNVIITQTQETNFETAYTHSQDNTQAHSDYVLNTGDDTLGSGSGFALTFDAGATDPIFTFGSDNVAITNAATFTIGGAQVQTGADDDQPDDDSEVPDTLTIDGSSTVANGALDSDLQTLATPTTWRLFYSNNSSIITEFALGSSGQYLKSQGTSSIPTWDTPAGSGDVEKVGDCEGGDCLDGSSDGGTYIRIYDGDSNYLELNPGDLSTDRTLTTRDVAGTLLLSGDTLTGDVTATFDTDGSTATTIATGAVADNEIDYANVTLDDFDYQTAWRLFYSNTDGDVTELALGSSGQYLKSQGASSAPTWDTPAGGGGSSRWTAESGSLEDQDADTMRITTTDDCDDNYPIGTPIRYSDDQSTYYYGIVVACTDNGSTLDVDLDGFPLSASCDAYFEYGIPEALKTVQLVGVGNASVSDTWFPKYLWGGPDAYLVRIYIYVDTAPAGSALEGNVECNSNNALDTEWSISAAGSSTDSGTTIDDTTYSNAQISQDEFVEIDVSAVGSSTPGGNAAWALLYFCIP